MVNNPQGESSHADIKSVLGTLVRVERELRQNVHGKHPGGPYVLEAQSFVIQAIASLSKIFAAAH